MAAASDRVGIGRRVFCLRRFFHVTLLVLLVAAASPVSAVQIGLVDSTGTLKGTFPGIDRGKVVLADLDDFFRLLGFRTNWNSSIERMEVNNNSTSFRFRPGTGMILTSGNKLTPINKPIKQGGNLYLAIGSLVKLLSRHSGHSMIWNAARQQVQLQKPGEWSGDTTGSKSGDDPVGKFIRKESPSDTRMVVMVDPGHGGRDPGAIGSNGLYEKKVVLDVGLKLRNVLRRKYSDIKVKLTRKTDKFVPLRKRTQIANQLNADAFVSLHANSARSSFAKGFEVFTLSGEASDPSANELAEIENSALRYEGYSKEELDDVSWILWQLRSTINTRESRVFAGAVVDQMSETLTNQGRGMSQAPFWVLKDARMPAILVETGFLSNPQEAQRLADEAYRRKVARAIAEGIGQFRKNQASK